MNKQSASKLIALTAAATAATAVGGLTVHADTVPESAPVQQQASTVTDTDALQAANTQAENKLAADNNQANAADTAATTEKINSVSTAYQNNVNTENQAYQSAISQADTAHQSAVSQVTANAQAVTDQAAAARSAAISAANSDYQSAVNAAAAAKDTAIESAQTAKSAAVSQAQQSAASKLQAATADHQAKIDQQVAANTAAEQAAQQAVKDAEEKAKAQAQQAVKDAEEKTKAQAQQPKVNVDQSSVVDQWNQNPASKPMEKWKYESQSGPYYQQEVQQAAQENADYQSKAGNLSTAHNQNLNKIDADYQNQAKQVNQELANVQRTIKVNHEQAVKSATTNVDNQINAANETVNTAQKAVDNAQSDLNNVQKAAQTSTSNTDIPTSTKGFIDHYNAQKFELPKAYVNGLRNVHDTASSDQFEQAVNPDMKLFKMFDYQSDPDAAKEKVDVLHLTGQQILQLNLYSTRLINQIRAQFGMPAFKLNPQAIANAQRMANQQSAGKMSGHHADILKGAGENVGAFSGQITQDSTQKQMGLYKASGEHPDVWVKHGPNDTRLTYQWVNLSFKTMDDLQAGLFYTVTSMMFADSGQEACGHALNFSLWNQSPDSQMALGIESFANDSNPKEGSVYYRWIFTDSSKVNPKDNLDTTPTNAHGANIAQNYSAQIKSAQTALANAKHDLANAQNKLNTLKANRDQMIQDLVDKTKTDNSAVQKLQANLKDIKVSHDKAIKAENAKYNAELDKLNKAHQAKLDAIKANLAAQTAVASAKKHLADVKAANKAALDKLKAEDPTTGIKQAEQAAIDAANKAYDQAVSKATAVYDKAVSTAKAARDKAIDYANKQAVTPDTAAAIKKFDADYQKKLADLKSNHDAKLASLKAAYDQQIAQLKSDLQARIDKRAKALADLKQANAQALAELKAQHQTPTVMPSPDDPDSEIITVPGRQTPKADAPATKSDANTNVDAPAAKSDTDAPAAKSDTDVKSDAPAAKSDANTDTDAPAAKSDTDAPAAKSDTDTLAAKSDADTDADTPAAKSDTDTPAAKSDAAKPGADAPVTDHQVESTAKADTDAPAAKSEADHHVESAVKTNMPQAKAVASHTRGFQIILPAQHHTASANVHMLQAVSVSKPVDNQSATEQVLPQTGDRHSTGLVALGMMMLSFVAGAFTLRKKN